MVLVTVVMACWVKAQSAILRLLLAMRIFRVLMERPKPFSNCCWKPAKIEVVTEGLNKFAAELEEPRVISLDNDVHVVFECQLDRFLEARFQLAVMNGLVDKG